MKIETLEGIGTNVILDVFNLSFSDYFIPLKLTEEDLISKMLVDKINLNLSVGVFEQGQLIAFILHGIDNINDQKVVYNGGTGVIPNKRGKGLTKQMYRFILPLMVKEGVSKLTLEVISKNVQAIKSYKKIGFVEKKTLMCYKGDIKAVDKNVLVKIKNLDKYNWVLMRSFWDINPTWQNTIQSIQANKGKMIALGAYVENKMLAYLIYNPFNKRIQQIAVNRQYRQQGIASALIDELVKKEGYSIGVINVDENASSLN